MVCFEQQKIEPVQIGDYLRADILRSFLLNTYNKKIYSIKG